MIMYMQSNLLRDSWSRVWRDRKRQEFHALGDCNEALRPSQRIHAWFVSEGLISPSWPPSPLRHWTGWSCPLNKTICSFDKTSSNFLAMAFHGSVLVMGEQYFYTTSSFSLDSRVFWPSIVCLHKNGSLFNAAASFAARTAFSSFSIR